MKRISLLFVGFSLLILMSLQAQEKGSFTIKMVDQKYIPGGSVMSKSYDDIEIVFDQSMGSFTLGVFSAKPAGPVFINKKFGKREEDIPFTGGLAKITFLNDHKIKECPEISTAVPDTFIVKVNNISFGPFFLKPKPGAKTESDKKNGKAGAGYKNGILFYDALYLNTHKNDRKYVDTIKLIFKYYNIYNADSLRKNPFLKTVFKGLYTGVEGGGKGLDVASLASGIGGLDVTSIAYGLADFLVKRTKEELNVAFFSKFTEALNDSRYADIRILFPNTCELLQAIGDQVYDYNKYLQNLREAFLADIITLDANLPGIIPNHQQFFNQHFGLAVSLNSACFVTSSLKNGMHPGDILDQFPLDLYFKRAGDTNYFNKNWSGAIQTLQLISQSLRETADSTYTYWVSFPKVKELVNNKDAFQIYLGLIYQVAKNERFKNIPYQSGSFVELLNAVNYDVDYPAYKSYISNFAAKVSSLNQMIKNQSKPKNDSMAFENYARYFKSTVDLLEYSTMATSLPHFDKVIKINLHDTLRNYFKIAYETTDLACDINRKSYSSAVNHAVTIYNLVRTKPLNQELDRLTKIDEGKEKPATKSLRQKTRAEEKYNKAISQYVEAVYGNATSDSVKFKVVLLPNATNTPIEGANGPINKAALEDSATMSKDLLEKLTRYGAFISTVATAKNPDEVEKAIEAAALPSGSSRIKRETPFNVSLNAYTGLFIGHETIIGVNDKLLINNYGVTAPIGVSISTGGHSFMCWFPNREGHWSYSAFISLVDIGAVASFRFQNTTDTSSIAQVPTIQLRDIFSPGLFLSIGFPKCPLSLNMGAQVGPNLRNVSVTEKDGTIVNKYQDNVYWRFSVSLVVDIPIFNFYTKSKH